MRQRFSREEIVGFLRQAAAGAPVMDLCWNHCFSQSTFRAWKAKYGVALDAKAGRLRQLRRENARLRNALARASTELERLRRQSSGTVALASASTARVASYRVADGLGRPSALHDAD
jgi:putative transposase